MALLGVNHQDFSRAPLVKASLIIRIVCVCHNGLMIMSCKIFEKNRGCMFTMKWGSCPVEFCFFPVATEASEFPRLPKVTAWIAADC